MPPTASDPSSLSSGDRSGSGQDRSWRSAVLNTIARVFESIARAATRIAERARAASGTAPESAGPAPSVVVGDVVSDAEIESARGLFGMGSGPVDTDPSWPHGAASAES